LETVKLRERHIWPETPWEVKIPAKYASLFPNKLLSLALVCAGSIPSGQKSAAGGLLDAGEKLSQHKTVIMKDCGHAPMIERPEESATHYKSFLAAGSSF